MKTRIVVGVDGSAGSTAAVRWAAAEARLRKVELRVLTAYHRQQPGLHFTGGQTRPVADEEANAVVHAAVTEARSIAPDVEVRAVALHGYAVPVLLHAAEEAALVVVGARGEGGVPGLPFGSVGSQVATHASASVVVVRGRSGADTGPVVVGVDESPNAGMIIGRAFEEAALHGASLVAITVQTSGRLLARTAQPTAEAVLGSDLNGVLGPWREKYPEVPAERAVVAGRPDKVLVQHSRQAQLVVVGPRRHGFEGVMLGSVGTRLVDRSDSPVLIARS
jgi:nucleotide-binding universal stress UspA family protein